MGDRMFASPLSRWPVRGLFLLLAFLPAVLFLRLEAARAARPNVILIQTDDQSSSTLRAKYRGLDNRVRRAMPNTLDLIAARGTEFTRYYATQPVCGPSRAALLTGQYAHTSGLKRNSGRTGGWTGWQALPLYRQNLATRLQGAGYRTVHIGKFTNNYMVAEGQPETTVPPGWDSWHTMSYLMPPLYYGYYLNRNGTAAGPLGSPGYDLIRNGTDPVTCTRARLLDPASPQECMHATDVYTRTAVDEIRSAGDRPIYLQLDYNSPHGDGRAPAGPEPTTRNYDTAFGSRAPRTRNFNEADLRDKPRWLKRIGKRLGKGEIERIDNRWAKELESLRDVDDGVEAIVKTLRQTGKLRNTYLIFLSDNGLFHGEHRLSSAKFLPYEPAARVPMMIRGPGVPRGRSGELAANVDIAPTVLDLAGIGGRARLDGRSLRPFWKNPKRRTRRPLFIESWIGNRADEDVRNADLGARPSVAAPALNYRGIRVGRYKYVQYASGDTELYDLVADPHELNNRVRNRRYRPVLRRLKRTLRDRQDCRAAQCRRMVSPLPARKAGRAARK